MCVCVCVCVCVRVAAEDVPGSSNEDKDKLTNQLHNTVHATASMALNS